VTGPAVLVVTHWLDPTADFVVAELNRQEVRVLRFDTADFPLRLTVTGVLSDGWTGTLRLGTRSAELTDISGIYYRRPTGFEFGPMPQAVADWARAEARGGLGGLLMAQQRWLNHPHRMGYAEYKPVQLAAAAQVGLRVPATIITNDPAEARAFAAGLEQVIYKPLSAAPPPGPGDISLLYTSVVDPEHLDTDGASVAGTMHLFQERVRSRYAVRLTMVDDQMFAAAIYPRSPAAELDWRADQQALTYEIVEVPAAAAGCAAELMRVLGLRFGALDFLVTPEGEWVFLEVNPNGQWAFVEEATGLPIAAAIAAALIRETR
jgi:ATP-grasp ribosomal peptide maturase